MKKVLLSKMFVGKYNDKSIGHEIINFYKPDNSEDSFLYNTPYGNGKKVDSVILLGVPENYAYPVLAIALDVDTIDKTECQKLSNQLTYGGEKLVDIDFDRKAIIENSYKDKDISHITYRVRKGNLKKLPEFLIDGTLYKTQEKIYIIPATNKRFTKQMQEKRVKELQAQHVKTIILDGENPQHLYTYCECDENKNKELNQLLIDAKSFKDFDLRSIDLSKKIENIENKSFLNFIGKEYSEQVFTNMFYNILKSGDSSYRQNFVKFLLLEHDLEEGTTTNLSSNQNFEIAREKTTTEISHKGRLDLFIYNEEYIIVIENKINSLLNGKYEDNGITLTQLDKYREYAEKLKSKNENLKNSKILVFLFAPNYSSIKKTDGVNSLTYKQLYDWFKDNRLKNFDSLFYKEFLNGLLIHSLTREEDITRRFLNILNK